MVAHNLIFSRKKHVMILGLFFSCWVNPRTNVVIFSEQEILESTAQGQGTLKSINKFEDKIIALIEVERARVVESEKEIAELLREYEQRVVQVQKNGKDLTVLQQKSLQQESGALLLAQQELMELQNQFYQKAQRAKELIDEHYVASTAQFYRTIFGKYGPIYGWDIVISRNSSDMVMFAKNAIDITTIILKNLKKQSDIQSKRFTTVAEVKALFVDLGLEYIDTNILTPKLMPVIEQSRKQYYQLYPDLMDRYLHVYGDAIAQKQRASISVAWVSDKVGWGVFAAKDISDGEFIQEYTGVVVESIPGAAFDSTYAWKLFKPDGIALLLVDAKHKGNEMRFVNHSNHPNVVSQVLIGKDRQYHVCYLAKGFIKAGEQLLVSYGKEYWNDRNYFEELFD